MSYPTQAVVVKSVPQGIDPTQVDYTSAGQAAGAAVSTIASLIRGPSASDEAVAQAIVATEEDEDGLGATPWIIGGVALVGIAGVAFAFGPRD